VRLKILILICLSVLPTFGIAQRADIYELKAVFLYNFSHFIQWPKTSFNSNTDSILYCTLANYRVYKNLKKVVKGEKINSRKFDIKQVQGYKDIEACHLLFIGESLGRDSYSYLELIKKKNILTVGESAEFLSLGGMINLNHIGQRIQIEVNLENIKNTELVISSKLLRLAKIK